MASLKEAGERSLVSRIIRDIRSTAFVGPGDDAACIDIGGNKIVISSDIVTFEKHMAKGQTPEQFGWLSAAVSFSDIAAMGARPLGILAAVSLHPDTDETVLYDIMKGVDRCAGSCGSEILGGDTKPGCGSVCTTALGICEHNVLTRSGARPGDLVAVTGTLGSAAAGWYAALNGITEKDALAKVMTPVPRIKEGMFLSSNGIATSCMDISDGLSATADAICRHSGTGMEIVFESLPVGKGTGRICRESGLSEEDIIMNGGGDYELLFTFPEEYIGAVRSSGYDIHVIGKVTSGSTVSIVMNGKSKVLENYGYEHFTEDRSAPL